MSVTLLEPPKNKQPRHANFIKDVVKLVSGTTAAQVLGVLASPFLTRYYGPDAFGILAVFTSVSSILAVILCMRYEFAIVLPESDEEASNLLVLSLGIAFLFALVTVPVFALFGSQIAGWLSTPELSGYMWWIPVALLFGGMGMGHPALNYWATRTKRFNELSITKVIGAAAAILTQIAFGITGLATAGGLIGGGIVGAVVSPLVLAFQILRKDAPLFFRSVTWNEILSGLKRYQKFPLFGIWSALLNTVSWQLPVFMLSIFFSASIVGYYSLGFRMLQMPMNLVGDSIGQVFFQRAVEEKNKGTLASLVEKLFQHLVTISLLPTLVLAIIGKDLFSLVFGADWAEAGVYVQILSIWAFFWFISGPFTTLFAVLEKQEIQFQWNIATLITRVASLAIGGFMHDARMAITLFSFTGVFVYGYKVYINLVLSQVSLIRSLRILGRTFLKAIPALIILLGAVMMHINPFVGLAVATLVLVGHALLVLKEIKNAQIF